MSIKDKILDLCNKGRLYRLVPEYRIERERRLYMACEVREKVLGPGWRDADEQFRWQSVRADLDWFIQAKVIVVPIDSQHGGDSFMSQLKPPDNEVWDIRCRDPEPGIRVLGSFAEKDVFVALTWELRNPLGGFGSAEWEKAVQRCKAKWNELFALQPMSGRYPDDYITNAISLGDD